MCRPSQVASVATATSAGASGSWPCTCITPNIRPTSALALSLSRTTLPPHPHFPRWGPLEPNLPFLQLLLSSVLLLLLFLSVQPLSFFFLMKRRRRADQQLQGFCSSSCSSIPSLAFFIVDLLHTHTHTHTHTHQDR